MQWRDQAIVLSAKKFMENSAIVRLFTLEHGVHSGLVKYINSKQNRGIYDVGNWLSINWKARLSDQLGIIKSEVIHNYAVELIFDKRKLYTIQAMTQMLQVTLPEHEPYNELFEHSINLIQLIINRPDMAYEYYAIFEFLLLKYIGFAIDLSKCAASDEREDLIYVSPKSARAVSRNVGEKYKDKLLKLPRFLLEYDKTNNISMANPEEISLSIELTGYFLIKNLFMINNVKEPQSRRKILELVSQFKVVN